MRIIKRMVVMKRKNVIPLLVLPGVLILPGKISLGFKGHEYYYDNGIINEAISAWEK